MSAYVQAQLERLDQDKTSFIHSLGVTSYDVRALMKSYKAIVWSKSKHHYWIEDDEAFSNACVALGAFYMSKRDKKPCVGEFSFNGYGEEQNFDFSKLNDKTHMINTARIKFSSFFTHYQRDYLYKTGGFGGGMPNSGDSEEETALEPKELPKLDVTPEDEAFFEQVDNAFHNCINALPERGRSVFLFRREQQTLEWIAKNWGGTVSPNAVYAMLQKALRLLADCLKNKGIDRADYLIDARVLD